MSIGKILYNFFLISQIAFLLLFYYMVQLWGYSQHYLMLVLLVVVVNYVFYFVRVGRSSDYKAHIPSITFLLGYFFVFFQKYIDLVLGYTDVNDAVFASIRTINKCSTISAIGLLSFLLGYGLLKKPVKKRKERFSPIDVRLLKLFLLVSTVLFVYYNYDSILFQTYSQELLEAQAGTMSLYSNILFQISFFLYASYIVHNSTIQKYENYLDYAKSFGIIPHFCIIIFILFIIISGDRGPIIVISLAYWGAYLFSSSKSINWKWTVLFVFIGIIFISTLGRTRSFDKRESFVERFTKGLLFEDGDDSKSIFPYTLEYAGSVNALHYSVENVPSKHPFLHGSFQARQVFASIPFGDRLVSKFVDPHFKYRSSAFFVTWLIQGDFYTYGSGTNCNADLYLSFGLWGVILGLFMWGIIYNRLSSIIARRSYSIVNIILLLYFLSYSVYVCRASLLSFLNFVCFTLLLDLLYRSFFQR